jgi:hypothetical protein
MKTLLLFLALLVVLACFVFAGSLKGAEGVKFSSGLQMGYNSGLKFQTYGMISNFAEGFPMSARIIFGYNFIQPGNATAARRIFINNNTNGIPEDKGRILDFRFDLMIPVSVFSIEESYIIAGPRHSRFKGNFKYIGGNEDFDVTSNQWGLGTGLESYFPMSSTVDLILTSGLDYFFEGTLTGHDTSYSPDDENVNPREDYTYDDADKAIDQPKLMFSILLGFRYNF